MEREIRENVKEDTPYICVRRTVNNFGTYVRLEQG